jgi:membrane-associated phospholipid phosphatase
MTNPIFSGASLKGYRTFLIASAVFLLCAILLGIQAKGAGPLPGDLEFTQFLQNLLPYCHTVSLTWTVMGELLRYSPYFVFAVLLGLRKWDWALLLGLVYLPMALFGESQLKPIFGRPRPSAELITVYSPSKGLSFPSGTALNAMAVAGVVLYLARLTAKPYTLLPRLVVIFSLVYLFLTCLARVHVGVHWATDILGGWMFASAWVALLLAGHQWWLSRDSGPEQVEED